MLRSHLTSVSKSTKSHSKNINVLFHLTLILFSNLTKQSWNEAVANKCYIILVLTGYNHPSLTDLMTRVHSQVRILNFPFVLEKLSEIDSR